MMMNGSKFLGLTAIFKDSTHLLGHRTTFFEQLDRKIEIEIERKVRAAEGRSEEATADDKMGCWVAALQALSAVVTIFNENL